MRETINSSESSKSMYFELKDIRQFLASISKARDRLMLRLLYETGCSLVELVEIKIKDILGQKIIIKNLEKSNYRYSKISSKLAKDLMLYIKGNNLDKKSYLFSTRQGQSISKKRIRQLIHYYSQKYLNTKINPQSFRYMHIAHAYSNGVLLDTIAKQIGITTFRIFQIINELDLNIKSNYNPFLKRIWKKK